MLPPRSPVWASSSATLGRVRSILYTLKEAVKASSSNGTVSAVAVLGVVSLIFWSLIVVISVKYAFLIMRADNHGEGGILALLALISSEGSARSC
jgi:KUP system potassium uptake protein